MLSIVGIGGFYCGRRATFFRDTNKTMMVIIIVQPAMTAVVELADAIAVIVVLIRPLIGA